MHGFASEIKKIISTDISTQTLKVKKNDFISHSRVQKNIIFSFKAINQQDLSYCLYKSDHDHVYMGFYTGNLDFFANSSCSDAQ